MLFSGPRIIQVCLADLGKVKLPPSPKGEDVADIEVLLGKLDDDGIPSHSELDRLKPHIRFDWDASPGKAWPENLHPAGHDSWSIDLKPKRSIWLDEFHQFSVYAGMLAGIPSDTTRFAADALQEAERLTPQHLPTLILQPLFREFISPNHYGEPRKKLRVLPPIASVAAFKSSTTASSPDNIYSSLRVLWFQETFGLPTDPQILEQLRAIDWEREAVSWDP